MTADDFYSVTLNVLAFTGLVVWLGVIYAGYKIWRGDIEIGMYQGDDRAN